jgi:hypothetical protein
LSTSPSLRPDSRAVWFFGLSTLRHNGKERRKPGPVDDADAPKIVEYLTATCLRAGSRPTARPCRAGGCEMLRIRQKLELKLPQIPRKLRFVRHKRAILAESASPFALPSWQ